MVLQSYEYEPARYQVSTMSSPISRIRIRIRIVHGNCILARMLHILALFLLHCTRGWNAGSGHDLHCSLLLSRNVRIRYRGLDET